MQLLLKEACAAFLMKLGMLIQQPYRLVQQQIGISTRVLEWPGAIYRIGAYAEY